MTTLERGGFGNFQPLPRVDPLLSGGVWEQDYSTFVYSFMFHVM